MKKLYKYLPLVFLAVFGCGEDDAKRLSDEGYFPLRTGFYQVYSVHEIKYELQAETENSIYQLKTEVVDSFVNQDLGYTYTIHRSKRNTVNDPWVFEKVWSVRMSPANVVVSEENIPFVKIVFPAVENRHWDGNSLNSLPADDYQLTNTGTSYELASGEIAGNFIQIVQEDSGDLFHVNKRQEFYVRDIGLVQVEIMVIEYCSDADECDITQKVIDNGAIYVQTLIGYGQN